MPDTVHNPTMLLAMQLLSQNVLCTSCSIIISFSSFQLHCAPCPLHLWAGLAKISLVAVEEVFASDATTVTHASEDASLIVKIDRAVELGNVSRVHD